jgi:MinD-like ATPase involved in chromosome partitioning or flagellar assembly
VSHAIDQVVAETAAQQQKLLTDANDRSAAIENEYKLRLQERVNQLDNEKAILLAELEHALNERQEAILLKARANIDLVQDAANQQKMAVFKEAQARANQQVDQITGQVAELAAEDAQRRLQSTTQTVRILLDSQTDYSSYVFF